MYDSHRSEHLGIGVCVRACFTRIGVFRCTTHIDPNTDPNTQVSESPFDRMIREDIEEEERLAPKRKRKKKAAKAVDAGGAGDEEDACGEMMTRYICALMMTRAF